MGYEREYQIALQAVRNASAITKQIQATRVSKQALIKKDKSPVTVADYASQIIITGSLKEHFPKDPIIAEEESSELIHSRNAPLLGSVTHWVNKIHPNMEHKEIFKNLGTCQESNLPKRFWTIDPIDGTKGFMSGRQYAIALALVVDGEITVGVLGCPNLETTPNNTGALFSTRQGQRAFQHSFAPSQAPIAISVAKTQKLRDAILCESVESAHSNHQASSTIANTLGITSPPYRIDSQCKYAIVSKGDASIYLRYPTQSHYREKIWDHAAGVAILKAAGGQVTDIDGNSLDFTCGSQLEKNRGVIATCGGIHKQVLDAVSSNQ